MASVSQNTRLIIRAATQSLWLANHYQQWLSLQSKTPLSLRSFHLFLIEALSRLSLADDDNAVKSSYKRGGFRPVERKRRRRGSRSVSGPSNDRSGILRCSSVVGQVTTCSEFQFTVSTDSSVELFCEVNWSSDVSEAARNSPRDRDSSVGEKEGGGVQGFGIGVSIEPMGNESGYGSEPGYPGDAEIVTVMSWMRKKKIQSCCFGEV